MWFVHTILLQLVVPNKHQVLKRSNVNVLRKIVPKSQLVKIVYCFKTFAYTSLTKILNIKFIFIFSF